jgi:hypothetical protein
MPLDPRTNWVFRVTPVRTGPALLQARRRSLFALAVAPMWLCSAALFVSIWPWRAAAGHLLLLGLYGTAVAELCLHGTQKLPFTCSYLPGKTRFHLTFWWCISLIVALVEKGAQFERQALEGPAAYGTIVAALAVVAGGARWYNRTAGGSRECRGAI